MKSCCQLLFVLILLAVMLRGGLRGYYNAHQAAPATPQPAPAIPLFSSAFDNRSEPHVPLLIYGDGAEMYAKTYSETSTLSCLAVHGLDKLQSVLEHQPVLGIQAMSERGSSGGAGSAIEMYRRYYPNGLAIYSAWTYNINRAAKRAIEYRADGICLPGVISTELEQYVIELGKRKDNGSLPPTAAEQHRLLLKQFEPKSPFWRLQDHPGDPTY